MRKVIRKRVRRSGGGVNIAADVDAVIAVNSGADAQHTRTVVRSSHSVVQADVAEPPAAAPPPSPSDDPPREQS